MRKAKYYTIDTSPFNVRLLMCFDQAGADKVLSDFDIDFDLDVFDLGVAETHYISDGREGIILVIFDPSKCDSSTYLAAGIVAHEAYHITCRIFQHIGQPLESTGEEIIAYTIEHLTKQMLTALEKEINARKASRSETKQAGQTKRRTNVQVDQLSDGRTGSNSDIKPEDLLRRIENGVGYTFSETEVGVSATDGSRPARVRATKLRGH